MLRFFLSGACVSAALLACADTGTPSSTSESAAVAARFSTPWDLVWIYPDATTKEARDALPALEDVHPGIFEAAFGHMSGRFPLPGAAADDAPVSPDDPQVLDEACLRDPAAWRVTQVRLAPQEIAVPGSPAAYRTWAEARGSRLDRVVQVRLSIHPFCESPFLAGFFVREDQAMHLVYDVAPADAALAAEVFDRARSFTRAQLVEDRDASYADLERHRAALASPAWSEHRRNVLLEWASLARTADGSSRAALDAEASSFRSMGMSARHDPFGHPNATFDATFETTALRDPATREALRRLVAKYARPERLARAALMFTVGSQDGLDDFQVTRWFFSQLDPGRYGRLGEMPADAAQVYGSFSPAPLDTFVAVVNDRGVDVVRASSAGFYSESRGVVSGPTFVYPRTKMLAGRRVEMKPLVDAVDFAEQPRLDPDSIDMPILPTGAKLRAAMDRFSDPRTTNATTTGCDRCHNLQNVKRIDGADDLRHAPREGGAYQFAMIQPSTGLSLRTVRELDAELEELRAELP